MISSCFSCWFSENVLLMNFMTLMFFKLHFLRKFLWKNFVELFAKWKFFVQHMCFQRDSKPQKILRFSWIFNEPSGHQFGHLVFIKSSNWVSKIFSFLLFYHVLYEFFGNFRTKNRYDFDKILWLNFKSIKSETDCYWSEKIPNIIFTTGTYAKCEKTRTVRFSRKWRPR